MTQTGTPEIATILTDRRQVTLPSVAQLVRKASAKANVGAGRMFREIVRLAFRPQGLSQHEYFGNHLYRPDLTWQQKREYTGEKASYALNQRLAPRGLTRMAGFLNDKVAITSLWHQFGLPTTVTQAVFTPDRWLGAIPTLRSADEIRAFLTGPARYPLFGKPVEGLQAWGAVRVEGIDTATGTALLGDGRAVSLDELIGEIVRVFPEGYLFQDVVEQHPQVSAIAGSTVSTVRFVTVVEEGTPRVLYTVWKLASPTAMADNNWQDGSMLARLCAESGTVEYCVTGSGPDAAEVTEHPVSGRPIVGVRLPHWQDAVDLVVKAHSIFPINGVLGWDVALGPTGPVLIECNDNPGHEFYQRTHDRGILNPDLAPVFDRVEARNKRIVAERTARRYDIAF